MRRACSLGPECAGDAASTPVKSAPATAARRLRAETTCAVLVLTFMALVYSQTMTECASWTIRPAQPRPECLNRRTSPGTDSLCCCCVALLNAPQTASRFTALARSNDYLVARSALHPCGGIRAARCRARRDGIGAMTN